MNYKPVISIHFICWKNRSLNSHRLVTWDVICKQNFELLFWNLPLMSVIKGKVLSKSVFFQSVKLGLRTSVSRYMKRSVPITIKQKHYIPLKTHVLGTSEMTAVLALYSRQMPLLSPPRIHIAAFLLSEHSCIDPHNISTILSEILFW